MLEVEPHDKIIFSEQQNTAEIIIKNVTNELVTFKLQSTVHDKFRIRPRCGKLIPNQNVHVTIELEKNKQLSQLGRDRIQVLCMPSPITQFECVLTADFWRHNSCYDPHVEKHQITCYMKPLEVLKAPSSKRKAENPKIEQPKCSKSLDYTKKNLKVIV